MQRKTRATKPTTMCTSPMATQHPLFDISKRFPLNFPSKANRNCTYPPLIHISPTLVLPRVRRRVYIPGGFGNLHLLSQKPVSSIVSTHAQPESMTPKPFINTHDEPPTLPKVFSSHAHLNQHKGSPQYQPPTEHATTFHCPNDRKRIRRSYTRGNGLKQGNTNTSHSSSSFPKPYGRDIQHRQRPTNANSSSTTAHPGRQKQTEEQERAHRAQEQVAELNYEWG